MTELCIDFGGTNAKLGLLAGGDVIASRELPLIGAAADLTAIEQAASDLVTSADAGVGSTIGGIGIALPGVVNRRTGELVAAHGKYRYLAGVNMRAWAQDRFGGGSVVAVVENDARAALVGETMRGCAAGATDAVIVTLGTGIGTAAIMGGRLLRGAHDHAGILGGHVTVDVDAEPCQCGNIGCGESLASTWALEKQFRRHPDYATSVLAATLASTGSLGIRDVVSAAMLAVPDNAARDIVDRFVRVWGAVIVTLCHAYDPEVVIVSGGVMRARRMVLPLLESYVHEYLWSSSHRPPLLSPQAPELSVLRGLSVIARDAMNTRSSGAEQ